MDSRFVDYRDDGTTFEAYVAHDPGAGVERRRPCVLVAHQWAGQSVHERGAAEAYAAQGYVGIAIDVYGKGRRGGLFDDNSALMGPLLADRATLRRRMLAALASARALPMVDPDRVAAVGYCFGGLCVLDLARTGTEDVRGVVSIHGVLSPPNLGAQPEIRAKVLVLHGYDDPMAPPADMLALATELTDAKADWQLHAYGHAKHGFTAVGANAPERGIVYDEATHRRAVIATDNFLEEVLGSRKPS